MTTPINITFTTRVCPCNCGVMPSEHVHLSPETVIELNAFKEAMAEFASKRQDCSMSTEVEHIDIAIVFP